MSPVLLLLLLPPLLRTQVTVDFIPGASAEVGSSTGPADTPTPGLDPTSPDPTTPDPTTPDPTTPDPTARRPAEHEGSTAEGFLHHGDASVLGLGRCSRAYSPAAQTGRLPESFYGLLRPAMDALTNAANFLNMVFQASDLREASVREDMEWYQALTRALLEGDRLVRRALLTFDADPASPAPQLVLVASRGEALKVSGTIVLQDLSRAWQSLHPPAPASAPGQAPAPPVPGQASAPGQAPGQAPGPALAPGQAPGQASAPGQAPGQAPAPQDGWFSSFKFPSGGHKPLEALTKRLLFNDLATLDTPKWAQGDSYVGERGGVRWADAPYLPCQDGHFLPRWLLTLSTPFYGLKPDLTPEFRGVVRVDVDIQSLDLDQCSLGDVWFADTHQCNRTSMECEPVPGQGFRLDQYRCRCKEGYYSPPMAEGDSLDGTGGGRHPSMPVCLPCWPGCPSCRDGAPCWVQEDWLLRSAVLAVQGGFMLLVFVSMLAAYRHRRSRRIRASGLILLEAILFGSLLLYFPVFILYFRPSMFRCILLRWVRMMGFSIVYGTVTLKMYRVLKVFLSRTAQRTPYLSSVHLLRLLGVMLLAVGWFLVAWTAAALQNRDRGVPALVTSATADGQRFGACLLDRWDYMMSVAELLFLSWGCWLCAAVKPVPSAFHEPRYMGIAIHNELLLSAMFHLLRFILPSLHPDWSLLLSFGHAHATTTVTLSLLFLPKFLHVSKAGREEIAAEVYEDEVDLRRSGSYLNSSFHSAWSGHSLEPNDVRDELKKMYSQLEVHKIRKMTSNNPHLSKKRGSRLPGLGRSLIRRITEIPESLSRRCSRDERDGYHYSKGVTQSESFRNAQDNVSISHRGSISTPSPAMRKSHSEHDYARERDPLRQNSMLRATIVKRASQWSETDSLDIPPGVCKSASAQNLTIDNNLLYPDHTKLQKSWSLTSTNTPSVEDVHTAKRACSLLTKSRQMSIKEQTTSALQSQSFDKTEICPWDVEEERSSPKSQKHVTYAPSQSLEVHVCPWDHLPPPETVSAVEKGVEGQCDSPRPQAPCSASAPVSPRPKLEKDQRVFSLRATTQRWLSVKSIMGSVELNAKETGGGVKGESLVSLQSQESGGTASRSATTSRNPSIEKRALPRRSLTSSDGKPCLVKQHAVRLSSGDSFDRSPRRMVIVKSAVYPWDSVEIQKDNTYENVFGSRQNSIHSNASSWETGGTNSRTPSTHRRGSIRITPAMNVSNTDLCPWDVPSSCQQGLAAQRQRSIKANVCPWEDEEKQLSERVSACPWESQGHANVGRQESGNVSICPWESQEVPTTPRISLSMQSQSSHQSLSRATDICPWESPEIPQPSNRQDDVIVNVCPWDVQDQPEIVYENITPSELKGFLKVPSPQEHVKAHISPGVSQEMVKKGSSKLASTLQQVALHFTKHVDKTADSCPWEFPDPPEITGDSCHGVEGDVGSSTTKQTIGLPQETTGQGGNSKDSRTGVCPWEASVHGEETESLRKHKCPGESSQTGSNPTIVINLSGNTETTTAQDRLRAGACPWESEETNVSKMQISEAFVEQDTARADVCPWEEHIPVTVQTDVVMVQRPASSWAVVRTLGTESGTEQGSISQDVCPWDTETPGALKKQDSVRADVCPWDSEHPGALKKQDSIPADVCPWDTLTPGALKKQDSIRSDVCQQVTDTPGALKKQDSIRADVCQQVTDTPGALKKQDSIRADVCPWDTETPGTLKKQDSIRADVCPWDTETPGTLKKQDSVRADVCPWDTQTPGALKKQDSIRADVCPWDTDTPGALKKQDSVRSDVCQRVTEDPQMTTESRTDINSSDIEATETQRPEESPMNSGDTQPLEEPKANIPLSRRDALCPWQMEKSRSGSFTELDNTSDVFTWEPENIPEEDEEEDDAECAAEAFVFPPDL